MWSRYSQLWSQQPPQSSETVYRDLLGTRIQSLGSRQLEKVKIDCSFLPDSKWGVLGDSPPGDPAWLLYLQLQFSEPDSCKLENTAVGLTFEKAHRSTMHPLCESKLGPILTAHYGPSGVSKGQLVSHRRPATVGLTGRDADNQPLLYAQTWPVDGDASGFHRRVEWTIKEPYPEHQMILHQERMQMGLVITHDRDPFLIKVRIEGKLQGRQGWFKFSSSTEPSPKNLRVRVSPSDNDLTPLDNIAKELNNNMTALLLRHTRDIPNRLEPPGWHGLERQGIQCPPPASRPPSVQTLSDTRETYTVGWVCALPVELAAAKSMLDTIHHSLPTPPGDQNNYTFGSIGPHNIVVVCLPAGVYGIGSAATVATQMTTTFPSIRISLMVGIGGGVPGTADDIRLGDVVVSKPQSSLGGVLQYDHGKIIAEGKFKVTGVLNKPPLALLQTISKLQAEHMVTGSKMTGYVAEMLTRYQGMQAFAYPGQQHDSLFKSEYDHPGSSPTCEECDVAQQIHRRPRDQESPKVHYGIIASASQVMKHGRTRDRIAREHGVICFEMEAAGLMDSFPCLVIRGICDYADTHKNDIWHKYAAATAAAYAKEFLSMTPVRSVKLTPAFQSYKDGIKTDLSA